MDQFRRLFRVTGLLAGVAACSGQGASVCDDRVASPCAELGGTWNGGTACHTERGAWNVSACVRTDPARWETVKPAIRDTRWATAHCNDGTPFDFQIQLAPQASKLWVIYLTGGSMCDDLGKPCSARERELTTSSPQIDRELSATAGAGILSRDARSNATFAAANYVRATYCSSDFWSGATTERRPSSGDAAIGWYFSGHINVAALLEVIAERYGLDDSDPQTEVLFAGSSAGALGVHLNAAVIEAALPAAAARHRVRLLIDAGWIFDWIDPDPAPPDFLLGAATIRDDALWRHARTFWGATFDPRCEAAVVEPSTCLFGPVWYPHVAARLPVLIQQSRVDAAFTGLHGIDATQTAPLAAWRQQAEDSLADVSWLFSGDSSYHVLVDGFFGDMSGGLGLGPAGSTLGEVIARFWTDGSPERVEF